LHAGLLLAEDVGEARVAGLEDDLLPLVRLAVRALRRVGVREVVGGDVHAKPLGGHARGGDADGAEETAHQEPVAGWSMPSRCFSISVRVSYSIAFCVRPDISRSRSTLLPSACIAVSSSVCGSNESCSTAWSGFDELTAKARAPWKSTSERLKPAVFALARLFERTCCSIDEPWRARCTTRSVRLKSPMWPYLLLGVLEPKAPVLGPLRRRSMATFC